MDSESLSSDDTEGTSDEDLQINSNARGVGQAWVSVLSIAVCVFLFIGLSSENGFDSWESISKWGYVPATSIREGAYWSLVTSAFVHFALWHLAFNVYWLWILGSRMERTIGSWQFLAFVLSSAFISSSAQLAVSDDTGIGASGIVYAIFGFMLIARRQFPAFDEVLDQQTVNIFLLWLVGCVLATWMNVWTVGNTAHFAGIFFGGMVADCFVAKYKPRMSFVGLTAIILLCTISLFWSPWSISWLTQQAYAAHANERYERARDLYSRIIRLDPGNSWAYENRSAVFEALGEPDKARLDMEEARRLNPSSEGSEEAASTAP